MKLKIIKELLLKLFRLKMVKLTIKAESRL